MFCYNIREDIADVHPPHVCNSCRRKLDRCRNNDVESCKIAQFVEHQDSHCEICYSKLASYHFSIKIKDPAVVDKVSVKKIRICDVTQKGSSYGFQQLVTDDLSLDCLVLSKPVYQESVSIITLTIKIFPTFTWQVFIYERLLPNYSAVYKVLPTVLTLENVDSFFDVLSKTNICIGNNEFQNVINHKFERGLELTFLDKDKDCKAVIETNKLIDINKFDTIRGIDCDILIHYTGIRCNKCLKYRSTLNMQSIHLLGQGETKKHTPNIFLNRSQLEDNNGK